ncbi:hypothetical protein CW755_13175 [Geobacillus thermodenitrificans]|uniref:Uncharacterized protein n=1 Tax=Geobacillus thermodenitrificans (strain NG80-2) TaxID=420246 RepID=A4IQP6_GEOTN|nr:hypothetical protein GTNG_2301 [Geobacillus thermodenitrificans NG80-2]MED0662450.1 hypothetical protein [Geobacillus thermodenitrificans]NNU87287.1 hypothetical protein [Geobacillus sp. MR]PJW21961.1 hypothetical protein CV632_01150 [Geobacillus thermodenitrificans]PTR46521.1 hypothetical protein CW755_13175 [Geobacillus thermodenitrificans]
MRNKKSDSSFGNRDEVIRSLTISIQKWFTNLFWFTYVLSEAKKFPQSLVSLFAFLFIAQNQPMYYNKHRTRFFPRKRICSFGMRHLRTLTASGG